MHAIFTFTSNPSKVERNACAKHEYPSHNCLLLPACCYFASSQLVAGKLDSGLGIAAVYRELSWCCVAYAPPRHFLHLIGVAQAFNKDWKKTETAAW